MLITDVRKFIRSRDLLLAWTSRTIRGRYQQSVLGWFWAIIQPAAQVLIFSIIFTRIVPIDTGDIPYPIFSYIAVVPWTFLSSSITDMTASLIQNMGLVTKIYFPREALPAAALMARLIDFCVALLLLFALMLYYQIPLFSISWLFLPLVLLIQIFLCMGIGLMLSAANVFFRDIQSLLTLGIQLWFYASPIIYPVTMVPESIRPFYFLNPMVGILEGYRNILLNGQPPGEAFYFSIAIGLAFLICGYWFFKKVEFQFADIV